MVQYSKEPGPAVAVRGRVMRTAGCRDFCAKRMGLASHAILILIFDESLFIWVYRAASVFGFFFVTDGIFYFHWQLLLFGRKLTVATVYHLWHWPSQRTNWETNVDCARDGFGRFHAYYRP